jgi:ribonuclease PH
VDESVVLDLNYAEDSRAEVDMNVVMTESEKIIEIQGTAEKIPFSRGQMNELMDLAAQGIKTIIQQQKNLE